MQKGFIKSGAKVKKTGKSFAVVQGVTGEVLSRHKTKELAQKAASDTRRRNRGSALRSRKNRSVHGK